MAPQSLVLLGGELEHEILWKPINVAFNGAVEGLRLDAVESGEIDADNPRARRLLRRLEGAVGECDWGAEKAQGPIDLEPGVRDCCLPMNGTLMAGRAPSA